MPKLRRIPSSSNSSSSAVATDQPVSGVYSRRSINGRMPSEERAINIAEMMGATPGVDDVDAAPMQREAVNAAKVFSISGGNSGLDNHGHSISEISLRPAPPLADVVSHKAFLATPPTTPERFGISSALPPPPPSTTASTAALAGSDPLQSQQRNMTPTLALRPRLGRRTSLAIDVVIILILGVWIGIIELGLIPHTQRGFHCDDRSISFPFQGDTISTAVILGSIPVPFVLMWISEAIFYKPASIKSTRLRKSLGSASFWFREYFIGMLLHLFIMDAVKVLVGELRPHFLDTCKPDAAINCTAGVFITDYKCTSTEFKSYVVRDSSKSFPSGHSSISFFEAVFMVWYIHRRVPQLRSRLLVPTIQTMLFFWACFCGFSRIVDHRHHWWDVLLGAMLGIMFGVLTCVYLCKDFKRKPAAFTQDVTPPNGLPDRHTSVRRLLAEPCCKDEVTMSHVIVT